MTPDAPKGEGEGRIGIVAGSGRLPIELFEHLRGEGRDPFVVFIAGEADPNDFSSSTDTVTLRTEDFGSLVPSLKRAGVKRVVMAGGVARRPKVSQIRWTVDLMRLIPRLARAIASGDDSLLRTVIRHIEASGIKVVGAQEIMPDLLAGHGAMTRLKPSTADMKDINAAHEAAQAIGRLDIGQAAIAIGGRAVALEGIEGTDGLLSRMVALRSHGRLAGRKGGALVKCAKPQQEMRADLPTIGPETIIAAHAAGLRGVAVDAEKSFILEYARTIALADEHGMFVFGTEPRGER